MKLPFKWPFTKKVKSPDWQVELDGIFTNHFVAAETKEDAIDKFQKIVDKFTPGHIVTGARSHEEFRAEYVKNLHLRNTCEDQH